MGPSGILRPLKGLNLLLLVTISVTLACCGRGSSSGPAAGASIGTTPGAPASPSPVVSTGTVSSSGANHPSVTTTATTPMATAGGGGSHATTAEGPSSGGGGDYNSDAQATAADVHEAIEEAKKLVPFVINYYETVITDARATGSKQMFKDHKDGDYSIPLEVYQALFPWPKPGPDARERWSKIELEIRENDPCYDQFRHVKAASAFPWESNTVCVSVSEIARHASRSTVLRRLTALLMHELSHKAGIRDEDGALKLETQVAAGIPVDVWSVIQRKLDEFSEQVSDQGVVAASSFALANHELSPLSHEQVCYYAAQLATSVESWGPAQRMDGYKLGLLPVIQQAEEFSIKRRAEVMADYCLDDEKTAEAIAKEFGKHQTRDVNRGGSGVLSIARGTWRRPVPGDFTNLFLEAADIQSSLKILNDALEAARSQAVPEDRLVNK